MISRNVLGMKDTKVSELKPGDVVQFPNGTEVTVSSVNPYHSDYTRVTGRTSDDDEVSCDVGPEDTLPKR